MLPSNEQENVARALIAARTAKAPPEYGPGVMPQTAADAHATQYAAVVLDDAASAAKRSPAFTKFVPASAQRSVLRRKSRVGCAVTGY